MYFFFDVFLIKEVPENCVLKRESKTAAMFR